MPRLYQYELIEQLPTDAITVSQYARAKGCDTSYVYHLLKRGKADFKIVLFHGINFVIPVINN
jgi:phage tail protein X